MSPWFLRILNMLGRLVGLGFLITGSIVVVQTLGFPSPPVPEATAAPPTLDVVGLVTGLVAVVIGVAFLRIRPWRPDLGDVSPLLDPFGSRGNSTAHRSWLTGDPKNPLT